jgi:hypothetical protein
MTLIELFFIVLYILLGAIGAMWGANRYGWLGGLAGFFVVVVGVPAVLEFLRYLVEMIYEGRPRYPACRSGKCHSRDYRYCRLEDGHQGLICHCGSRYRKRGRRFLEVQTDGSVRPYMIWKAFRGWFPDG